MLKTLKHALFRLCAAAAAIAGLSMFAPDALAQDISRSGGGTSVSGTVSDEQGPVEGAAVMIKGGQGGVVTDAGGTYTLS